MLWRGPELGSSSDIPQPLKLGRPARSPAAASIPLLSAFRGSLPLPLQTFSAFEPMATRARPLLILRG